MPSTELILSDFDTRERSLLSSILAEDSSVELNPSKLDPDQLWSALSVCGRLVGRMERASQKVKPVIGQLLLQLEQQPEVVQAQGFQSFDRFMSEGMPKLFGISRSEAYHLRRIAEKFPTLPRAEWEELGVAKLQLLARSTSETDRNYRKELENAKNCTVAELRERVCEKTWRERGELDFAVIQIETNRAFKQRWEEFCREPSVIAAVGTDNRSAILEALMGEASAEWFAQAQAQEVA